MTPKATPPLAPDLLSGLEKASLAAARAHAGRPGYRFLAEQELARRILERARLEHQHGRLPGAATLGECLARLAQTVYAEALYQGCRSANAHEQSRAYGELSAYLYRIAYNLVRMRGLPSDLAADCTQDALERVWRRIESCRQPAAFLRWAAVVLVHQAGRSLEQEPDHLSLREED